MLTNSCSWPVGGSEHNKPEPMHTATCFVFRTHSCPTVTDGACSTHHFAYHAKESNAYCYMPRTHGRPATGVTSGCRILPDRRTAAGTCSCQCGLNLTQSAYSFANKT